MMSYFESIKEHYEKSECNVIASFWLADELSTANQTLMKS